MDPAMKPIPIKSAGQIAEEFGYDQVIIYARKVDVPAGVGETAKSEIKGGEHMTTYGKDAKHCAAAAQIGDFLKFKIMGWTSEETHEDRRYEALVKALRDIIEANDDFRKGMPDGWEGDPLQDACEAARRLVGQQ